MKVVLTIGTSGSGKSTWVKTLPDIYHIISADSIRKELTGDISNKSKDVEIYDEIISRTVTALKYKDVILDTTNLQKDRRRDFIQKVKDKVPDVTFEYKLFECDISQARKRILADLEKGIDRADVSEETLKRHEILYQEMLEDIKDEPLKLFK